MKSDVIEMLEYSGGVEAISRKKKRMVISM